ncbi:hypothetical protein MJK70_10365 [Klebsiella pneumoniae]|nr:hypothetical protein MJK70_10365 [Klebsiella pneumoniae]
MSVSDAEPVMLEQISRISQQIGYYLHRAESMRGDGTMLEPRAASGRPPAWDSLTSALNKVYQHPRGQYLSRYLARNQLCW